jgi:hypothetical protein
VPVRLRDGAASVSIRRPDGVAVRVTLPDGAASVKFDDRRMGSIAYGTPVESPDYGDATDRYEVELQGGVAQLTVSNG